MPGTYPAAAPVLTGDSLAISRFLQNPELLRRRLRNFRDLRFVSDQLLTQRLRSSGGAVLYEQTEPFVTDRTVEAVSAGSEYPFANLPTGTAAVAAVSKWGQKVRLTDEEIERNVYAGAAVDRTLQKVVNSIISQVDSVTMSAIGTALADTATLGKWDAGTPKILNDILNARRIILARNLGYNPDTIVVSDLGYMSMMVDTVISNLWRRETTDNPVYTGQVQQIAGMTVVVTPNLPVPTSCVRARQQGARRHGRRDGLGAGLQRRRPGRSDQVDPPRRQRRLGPSGPPQDGPGGSGDRRRAGDHGGDVLMYKVLWPYVTIKTRTDAGTVLREFYAGAPVPDNADPDDRDRLLRKGAIVDESAPEAELVAVPAGTPIPGEPPNVPVTEQPAGGGSVQDRVDRALALSTTRRLGRSVRTATPARPPGWTTRSPGGTRVCPRRTPARSPSR
jgi:hypothetical protein